MTAEVEIQPITGLPVQSPPTATDVLLLVVGGLAKQAQLGDVRLALAVATISEKGLMSAADKAALDTLVSEVTEILAPTAVTIASSNAINVPTNTTFVILTGTTAVLAVTGLTNNRPCYFYYPSGAGLTFLGNPVQAGDPPLEVIQTAS